MAYCCSAETLQLMYYENDRGDNALTKLGKAKLAAKPCIACKKDVRIYGHNSWKYVRPRVEDDAEILVDRVVKYTGKEEAAISDSDVICRSCFSDMEKEEMEETRQNNLKARYVAQGIRLREKLASRQHSATRDSKRLNELHNIPSPRGSKTSPSSRIPKRGLFYSPQIPRRAADRIHRVSTSDGTGSETSSTDGDTMRSEEDREEQGGRMSGSLPRRDAERVKTEVREQDRRKLLEGSKLMSTSLDDLDYVTDDDEKIFPNKMSAVELKEQGNRFFANKKYDEAISCYTKAIMKNPQDAKFFTNRALCNMKLKKWSVVSDDCRHAIEIDQSSVKGYFFLGIAQLEQELLDEAITNLRKAHELAREQKKNFGDDIACQLRSARKKRWNILEEKRISQETDLQKYLNRLMIEDQERRTKVVDESRGEIGEEEAEEQKNDIQKQVASYKDDLDNLFTAVDERRKKRDVPDYLCGKISFELMRDPVITPSGITYDRKDIEQHLQRVGHFDPITRVKLTQEQLIPNLSMKEIINHFISENEWAEDY